MGTEELVLDLSLKYQALSKQTAFICKIQENVGKTEKAKIIIPSLISGDYSKERRNAPPNYLMNN
jgi:hypothetical protein